MLLLFVLLLAALGAHVLFVDLDIIITLAIVGVLYHLAVALIDRFLVRPKS